MPELEGRIALVTGGSRGIGAAICVELADAGAVVVVNYARNADAAAEVCERIAGAGGTAHAVQGDIGTADGAAALVDHVPQKHEAVPRRRRDLFEQCIERMDAAMNVP